LVFSKRALDRLTHYRTTVKRLRKDYATQGIDSDKPSTDRILITDAPRQLPSRQPQLGAKYFSWPSGLGGAEGRRDQPPDSLTESCRPQQNSTEFSKIPQN
jgi:hypothetical protein